MNTAWRTSVAAVAAAAILVASGCASNKPAPSPLRRPADVRAQIVWLLPASVHDRQGWAVDMAAAFAALGIDPDVSNLCATLAVTAQESTFTVDPVVPNLGRIARAEIERRAERRHVPELAVRAALSLSSPNGKSWQERIAAARTERQLSDIYDDFISKVPLGRRLFADANPVRTAGPMQVNVGFAEQYVKRRPYPYPISGSIRGEVFSRRGGLYFGIAHLLGYPAAYDRMLYRFADFNSGWYASRNAAFQNAVSLASGIPLVLDGDLINYDDPGTTGATELAVRSLARHLDISDSKIRRALERGEDVEFQSTALYSKTFALAEGLERKVLPRAIVPRITLRSPKISRKLTTEWFAVRVDQRYQTCLANASARASPSRSTNKR